MECTTTSFIALECGICLCVRCPIIVSTQSSAYAQPSAVTNSVVPLDILEIMSIGKDGIIHSNACGRLTIHIGPEEFIPCCSVHDLKTYSPVKGPRSIFSQFGLSQVGSAAR